MPTATVGVQRQFTAQGNASFEGFINLTTDGQYLVFAGYDAALGTPVPAEGNASVINRVVGRIDATGNVDTSTALTDWSNGTAGSAASARSVISTDGVTFLLAGAQGGVRQTTLGSTTSTNVATPLDNLRHIDLFGSQLFASTGITTGAPSVIQSVDTVGGVTSSLPGVPPAGSGGANVIDVAQFFMADLSTEVAGVDTLYIADSRSQTNGGGLRKFSLEAGTWVARGGVFYVGAPPAGEPSVSILRGLTGVVDGSNVTMYAIRNANTIQSFVDTSGYAGTMTGVATNLATAPANTLWKGLDFVPVVSPGGIPGDFNNDTFVDGLDLAQWKGDFGVNDDDSDADDDGDSDGQDFLIWQRNLTGGVGGAAAIPEPSAAVLGLIVAAAFALRRQSSF